MPYPDYWTHLHWQPGWSVTYEERDLMLPGTLRLDPLSNIEMITHNKRPRNLKGSRADGGEGSYHTAEINQARVGVQQDLFHQVTDYMEQNMQRAAYTSQTGEKTRMDRAQGMAGETSNRPVVRATAAYRAMEKSKGGPISPRSGPITITKIKVIKNDALWAKYSAYRNLVRASLGTTQPLQPNFIYQARRGGVTGLGRLPVIDASVNESLLFHGSTKDVYDLIANDGFNPTIGHNLGTEASPNYGLLGQGAYFADSFGKAMTYIGCRVCGDFGGGCRGGRGQRVRRVMLLSRVVLGKPFFRGSYIAEKMSFSYDHVRRWEGTDRLPEGHHSIYAQGQHAASLGFGARQNEFLIKHSRAVFPGQDDMVAAYPEFLVYYTLGNADDLRLPNVQVLADAVQQAIGNYRSSNRSAQSTNAIRMLRQMSQNVTAAAPDFENLKAAVYHYLNLVQYDDRTTRYGVGIRTLALGEQLKPDSSFYTSLYKKMYDEGMLPVLYQD